MKADRAAVRRHIDDRQPLPWPTARDLLAELGACEATARQLRVTNQDLQDRVAAGAAELQGAARSLEQAGATWTRLETEGKHVRRQAQRIYDAVTRLLAAVGATANLLPGGLLGGAGLGPPPPARGLDEQAEALEILAAKAEEEAFEALRFAVAAERGEASPTEPVWWW